MRLRNSKKMAETALQLFSRLGVKEKLGDLELPLFSNLSSESHGLKPGDVFEFCGAEGTGKSEILLNIAARCVLPKSLRGGKESEVVFISTDHKFDLQRLTTLIEACIADRQRAQKDMPSAEYKEQVLSCLSRVHIVYCASSIELTVTLQYLKTFLHNHSRISAVLLDNVATFYWMDKDRNEHQWISSLKTIVQEYHLIVFAAKPLLFQRPTAKSLSRESKIDGSVSDFMPKQWQRMVTHRFHLERMPTHSQSSFMAHQTFPPGSKDQFSFSVSENGLVFQVNDH